MNLRINLNDIYLERRDDLELLVEKDVTEKAPFLTGVYNRYRTTLPEEIHDRHPRGRAQRPEATSEPPLMPYGDTIMRPVQHPKLR